MAVVQRPAGSAVPHSAPCYDSAVDGLISLYDLRRRDLEALVRDLGEPRYRADQLWHWLYRQLEDDPERMTTLPKQLRSRLADAVGGGALEEVAATTSADGSTTKHLFRLRDGQLIETVLMHYVDPADEDEGDVDADDGHEDDEGSPAGQANGAAAEPGDGTGRKGGEAPDPGQPDSEPTASRKRRHTVCVSTQAGCAMGCTFCATGQMGLVRDLTLGECLEQIVWCARALRASGERLTNVVFMGMGEPLANWPTTSGAIEALLDPDGLALGARRVTVSTVGIVPGIARLAELARPVRLAVSIHAPTDDLRRTLVPVNDTYPLADVLDACRRYQDASGRRITFEYVLIRDVNDSAEHARALARVLRGLAAHVNLIPLNPTAGSPRRPSTYARLAKFEDQLRRSGVSTTSRVRRGIEIEAGCGQLRSRVADGLLGRTIAPAADETMT